MAKPKRPRDPNQLAKLIVDIASGDVAEAKKEVSPREAQASKAGQRGGPARAKALTPARRKEIAKAAAKSRWKASAHND
jgi:hypothetical protein